LAFKALKQFFKSTQFMKSKLFTYLVLSITFLSFQFSCDKAKENDEELTGEIRIASIKYYEQSQALGEEIYEYDASGRLTKIKLSSTGVFSFEAATQFIYASNSTKPISVIRSAVGDAAEFMQQDTVTFTWNGNSAVGNVIDTENEEFNRIETYTFNENNEVTEFAVDITSMDFKVTISIDWVNGNPVGQERTFNGEMNANFKSPNLKPFSLLSKTNSKVKANQEKRTAASLTYDTKKNPYSKLYSLMLIADWDDFDLIMPSSNNKLSDEFYTYTYKYNNLDYPSEMTWTEDGDSYKLVFTYESAK
jgi:hypothetical protein